MVVDETTKANHYGVLSCNEDGVHRYVMRLRHALEINGHVVDCWLAFDRRHDRWLYDVDVVRIPACALRERMLNG